MASGAGSGSGARSPFPSLPLSTLDAAADRPSPSASASPRVFWPSDAAPAGICFGWTHTAATPPVFSVAGVIPDAQSGDAYDDIQRAQHLLHTRLQLSPNLVNTSVLPPVILGRCLLDPPRLYLPDSTRVPRIILVHYRRPQDKSLRFYTLAPVSFGTGSQPSNSLHNPSEHNLLFSRPAAPDIMQTVVDHLNVAHKYNRLVQGGTPAPRSPAANPDQQIKSTSHRCSVLPFIQTACSTPLWPFSERTRARDVSAALQQLDVRAEQGTFLPDLYRSLYTHSARPTSEHSTQYSRFYNYIWLILNDMIVGVACGAFLCENTQVLAHLIHDVCQMYTVDLIQESLLWLDNWPAGLKLNTQLSHSCCLCLVGLIQIWGDIVGRALPYLPSVLFAIGLTGTLGLTFILALLSDLLALLTIHIYVCYLLATTVFRQQLRLARALWNLFRGKRFNVLRNRVDAWEYDVDQLLLGTVLFTLVAFLFPTVLVYYVLFAITRLAIIMVHAGLETLLAFLNHFPLFSLMLRFKDPWRLPGGIYFLASTSANLPPHLELKSRPVSFSHIFSQFYLLWSRLSSHYNPLKLMRHVVVGTYLTPISRYSIQQAHVFPP